MQTTCTHIFSYRRAHDRACAIIKVMLNITNAHTSEVVDKHIEMFIEEDTHILVTHAAVHVFFFHTKPMGLYRSSQLSYLPKVYDSTIWTKIHISR